MQQQPAVTAPQTAQTFDERFFFKLHDFSAHDTGKPGPGSNDQRQHQTFDAGAENTGNGDHKAAARNALEYVADDSAQHVQFAAVKAAEETYHQADTKRQNCRSQ